MDDDPIVYGDEISAGTTVAGMPVRGGVNGDGYFVRAAFEHVFVQGSPLVVVLTPPVATIDRVSAPALLGLIAALANGAVIRV